jgi:hypothetical protein
MRVMCRMWWSRGIAAEEGEEPVPRAGLRRSGDRRAEQGVPAGFGDEQRGDRQQVAGQRVRDRPALAAGLGDVPSVHGDLDGSGALDGDGGEWEVADVKYLAPVGGGACGEEPVCLLPDDPGRGWLPGRGLVPRGSG